MIKLKYVGAKTDGERAFKDETGIEWFPGAVEAVSEAMATKMLKHPDVFALADDTATLAKAKKPEAPIPAWAKEGIDRGMTDEQLEAVARAGGPETPEGKALWDAAKPAEPTNVIRLENGEKRVLDGMSRDALKDLAAELRVKVHPMSGEAKFMAALMAAYPVK